MLERPSFQPSAALAAYAEPLVSSHAVIVFGDASSGLGEHLLERGARVVHVYDRDQTRAAEAANRNKSNRLTIAPTADGGLALRDGAFDLAIVEDLGAVGDAAGLLRGLRRALSPRGVALIACPNPDVRQRLVPANPTSSAPVSFDYYALYDAVTEHFEHVRMLGQTPFVGYAVVDFAPDGEIAPVIDSDFVPGGAEEPEWYVAIGAHRPQALAEFTVVQFPFKSALSTGTARRHEEQLRAAQNAERRARARMADLEVQCAKLLREERPAPPEPSQDSLHRALEQRDNWIAQLEARALTADTRADEAQAELDTVREQFSGLEADSERARNEANRAKVELEAQINQRRQLDQELAALREELDQQRAAAKASNAELAAGESRLAELFEGVEAESMREVSALETQLQARGGEIQRLQRELKEAERLGRELLEELLPADAEPLALESSGADPELSAKLSQLAAINVEREGDLAAARWTIDELEARIEELQEAAPGVRPDPALSEELARAEARLQHQEVLLEQLRADRNVRKNHDDSPPAVAGAEERSLTE